MRFCSNCGATASGNFCIECGTSLRSSETDSRQSTDLINTINYEDLLSIPNVRDLIAHHATLSKQHMSSEEFLKLCDTAFVPFTGVPLASFGSIVGSMGQHLGVKTGKTRSITFKKPSGKILVALLCSLARQGQKVHCVQQETDRCIVEAVIASDLWTWGGSLIVSVQNIGDDTYVEAATIIKGQVYDWGKSNRCLEQLFSDLSMTPALM